jgi:hypothetical protein
MRSSALVVPVLAAGWLSGQSSPEVDWAFRPMRSVAVPTVTNAEWNGDATDRVVFARLQAGIEPNPRADRRTLLRRCTHFAAIGTSGKVWPAAGMLGTARTNGTTTWVQSLDAPDNLAERDRWHQGRAVDAVPTMLAAMAQAIGLPPA